MSSGRLDRVKRALEQVAQHGTPPRGTASLFDVGTERFRAYFEKEVLDGLIANGGATCKLIEGPYGSGKTHLLDLLDESARVRGMAVLRADLTQALSLENWQLVTQYMLDNLELERDGHTCRSLPMILEHLGQEDGFDAARLTRAGLPHPGFAAGMACAARPDLRATTREPLSLFLRGHRVSVADLRSYGVPKGVRGSLSARNAEAVMKTVFAGLKLLGVPGVVLLFDEGEATFTLQRRNPPQRVIRGANLLRRLIDNCASGDIVNGIVVLAVLPGFVDNCMLVYPALGQRLQVPDPDGQPGWRWPWLRVSELTPDLEPSGFLEQAATRFEQLVVEAGCQPDGLRNRFLAAGRQVLARQAGSGYRRPLIKHLATLSLHAMEGAGA